MAAFVALAGCHGTYSYRDYGGWGYRSSGHHSSSGYVSGYGYSSSRSCSGLFSGVHYSGDAEDALIVGAIVGTVYVVGEVLDWCWDTCWGS
jgi:hypothetical protein